jgi:hypothetical protein
VISHLHRLNIGVLQGLHAANEFLEQAFVSEQELAHLLVVQAVSEIVHNSPQSHVYVWSDVSREFLRVRIVQMSYERKKTIDQLFKDSHRLCVQQSDTHLWNCEELNTQA